MPTRSARSWGLIGPALASASTTACSVSDHQSIIACAPLVRPRRPASPHMMHVPPLRADDIAATPAHRESATAMPPPRCEDSLTCADARSLGLLKRAAPRPPLLPRRASTGAVGRLAASHEGHLGRHDREEHHV